MECEYCNKQLSSLSSLINHKKTAKYCIEIQNKLGINNNIIINKIKCNICFKTFADKRTLTNHLQRICLKEINYIQINDIIGKVIKENENINKVLQEKEREIQNLNNIIDFKEKINILEKEKYGLNEVNKILNSDHECIQEIAKQPKNITTNNNKVLNVITPFNITDKEQIIDIVKNNYNINYIFSGQKGCARFVYENIIKDNEGNLKYICSDPSRFIYKYKDEYGNIQKDIDARRLTNLLIEGGLKNKACDMASNWWTDENGEVNTDKFEMLIEKAEAIRTMEQDNTEFKKELATMTSV